VGIRLLSPIEIHDVPLEAAAHPAVPPEALCQCEPCLHRGSRTIAARQEAESALLSRGDGAVRAAYRVVQEVRSRVARSTDPARAELLALGRAQSHWARTALGAGGAPIGGTPFEVAAQVVGLLSSWPQGDEMEVAFIGKDGAALRVVGSPAFIVHPDSRLVLRGDQRFVPHAALLLCVDEQGGLGVREAVVRLARSYLIRRVSR
jgi:hypothetical protein